MPHGRPPSTRTVRARSRTSAAHAPYPVTSALSSVSGTQRPGLCRLATPVPRPPRGYCPCGWRTSSYAQADRPRRERRSVPRGAGVAIDPSSATEYPSLALTDRPIARRVHQWRPIAMHIRAAACERLRDRGVPRPLRPFDGQGTAGRVRTAVAPYASSARACCSTARPS